MKGGIGMETGMQEINVDEIMKEIRENIKKRGYSDDILSFSDVQYDGGKFEESEKYNAAEFLENVCQVNARCEISYYTPIPKKGAKNLIKCAIRKIMAFLILPIVAQQNNFNAVVARSLNCIRNYIEPTEGGSKKASSERMSLQEEKRYFENQERQTEKLETKVLLLQQEIEELKKQLQSRNG